MRSAVSFATSADGTRIAWSRHGSGPPLVRAGTWLTHLEHDWDSPVWSHWLHTLGARFSIVRYDERGGGLSDRAPARCDLGAWVADLEAVVAAARLETFTLLGMSHGGAVAVEYARRHPGQVDGLVLWGACARGSLVRAITDEDRENVYLRWQLIKLGWGRADPIFRRVFTSWFVPGATEIQMRWFDELQRRSMSPADALASARARAVVDVSESAAQLSVPTLAIHADGDRVIPFEEGRRLAGLIPDAHFAPLSGRNHLLLSDEPAWPVFVSLLTAFAGATQAPRATSPSMPLTAREVEVLRLVAVGCSNVDIGRRLALSTRTVERHLGNVYGKLSLTGKSARAAAAARLSELDQGEDEGGGPG